MAIRGNKKISETIGIFAKYGIRSGFSGKYSVGKFPELSDRFQTSLVYSNCVSSSHKKLTWIKCSKIRLQECLLLCLILSFLVILFRHPPEEEKDSAHRWLHRRSKLPKATKGHFSTTRNESKSSRNPSSKDVGHRSDSQMPFPLEECGYGWHRTFHEMHSQFLAENIPAIVHPRFITISNDVAGLADTLFGLGSAFLVALFDRRALVIQHQCLNEAFEPVGFNWRMSHRVPIIYDAMKVNGTELLQGMAPNTTVLRVHLSGTSNSTFSDPKKTFDKLEKVTNVIVTWNLGMLARTFMDKRHPWGFKLRNLKVKLENLFGCFMHYILRPRANVVALVARQIAEIDENGGRSICMHMRLTDELVWTTDGYQKPLEGRNLTNALRQANRLLRCAQVLENYFYPSPTSARWVFLSSSKQLKDLVKASNPNKVVVTDISPTHKKFLLNRPLHEQLKSCRETAAEWHLISRCNILVLPDLRRGFAKSAALYGLARNSIYLSSECSPGSHVDIETLANVSAHV